VDSNPTQCCSCACCCVYFMLCQVAREDHFAAVKNAPGSATDSPDTARAALLAQGARWVAAAGGQLAPGCEGVEVSPLVSYAGEGLQQLVQGKTLQVCVHDTSTLPVWRCCCRMARRVCISRRTGLC
jgi:hypothetical protein